MMVLWSLQQSYEGHNANPSHDSCQFSDSLPATGFLPQTIVAHTGEIRDWMKFIVRVKR